MIKSVIFDLGGVLVHVDLNRSIDIFKNRLKDHSAAQITDYLQNSDLVESYQKGELSSHRFFSNIRNHLNVAFSYSQFCDIWQDIFSPNESMIRFLEKIGEQYQLILLSNTNELHIKYLTKTYSFFHLFQHRFYSHQMGLLKPDPLIYESTLKQTGACAEECVFIDDTWSNIEAAMDMGMQGIHYVSFENFLGKWESLTGTAGKTID